MSQISSSDDGSNIAPEDIENNEDTPPSPTVSNSPPPSMVLSQKAELSKDDYRRLLMQWHHQRATDSRDYNQATPQQRSNHNARTDAMTPIAEPQTTSFDRSHDLVASSPVSRDIWRVRDVSDDGHSHNKNALSPYARDALAGMSFGTTSAAMAAAAAFTAASFTEEERARNAAATAAFWAGFRQAAVAAAVATTSKPQQVQPPDTFGTLVI